MLMASPREEAPDQAAEVERMSAALEAAGWERVDPGQHWYSARFVWRGDEPPPTSLDLPTPEITNTP
jgi:hypothetical protein